MSTPHLVVKLADSPAEIEQAFRLRYRAFVEEPGIARLRNASGLERDEYDDYCDHLIVKDLDADLVVGTYRVLPGRRVPHLGLYTASEFDLADFAAQVPRTLELGRACVHNDYRDGGALLLLWHAMLEYYVRDEAEYLIGCVSFRAQELRAVRAIRAVAAADASRTTQYAIRPLPTHRVHWPDEPDARSDGTTCQLPDTVRGYRRLGGMMVPEPAYDPVFDTYDFCMLMAKEHMSPTYRDLFSEVSA